MGEVLYYCVGPLALLDEDGPCAYDVVESATLLHGTSVVTDLWEDLEAVHTTKIEPSLRLLNALIL